MASIRKRGENSYLIIVSRGYDYQGNRLKSVQKTVHPPVGLTPRQTEKWLKEQAVLYENEIKHTPEPVNTSITLAKYTEHWMADVGPKKLAESTFRRDCQDIRRILPALGHYKLTELKKEPIREFYEQMRSEPNLRNGKPLSEKSVEGIHDTLCSILSDAVEEGYLTHNPAWRVYKPKGQRQERPVADEETVQRLITALEGQSLKYETYFKLVLATGMRRGEACGLRRSDVNWRKKSIHIQRNVVKLSHEPIIVKRPQNIGGGQGGVSERRDGQAAESVEKGVRMGTMAGCGRNVERGRLPVPPAQWRPDGADYLHVPVQKDSAAERPAGESQHPQPASHQRQPDDRPGRGCADGGRASRSLPAQYHTGYLRPRL